MQCIAWVHMNEQCATIKTYVPRIVDPSTAPRHFGVEAKKVTCSYHYKNKCVKTTSDNLKMDTFVFTVYSVCFLRIISTPKSFGFETAKIILVPDKNTKFKVAMSILYLGFQSIEWSLSCNKLSVMAGNSNKFSIVHDSIEPTKLLL